MSLAPGLDDGHVHVLRMASGADLLDLTGEADKTPRTSKYAIGKYCEDRKILYAMPLFGGTRTLHMGIDLFGPAGDALYALADGEVLYCGYNPADGDYGYCFVMKIRHAGEDLYALYGHLAASVLDLSPVGRRVRKGEIVAHLGERSENGGWEPHVHLQLSINDPGTHDMQGTVAPEERERAMRQFPDPRIVIGPIY